MIAIKLFYLPHLRMCHSEFKRSSKNRAYFKDLHAELKESMPNFDWRVFYPILACDTRWLGILLCAQVQARKSNRVLMKKYSSLLRSQKKGSRPFDPYKYRRRRGLQNAADAGGDDREGDSSSDEEAERVRVGIREGRLSADDDFVRQPSLFTSVQEAIDAAPSQEDLIDADDFDEGEVGASKYFQKNLLNKQVGLTDLNCGRSCYLAGMLKPYKVLVEQLQRVSTPEQHLAARRIRTFYSVMQNGWIGTDTSEPMYSCRNFHEWIQEMEVLEKHDLIRLVKQECRSFASIIVRVLRSRLRSIWQHIQALELIDPLGPELEQHATPAVWDALKDLCRRRDIDFFLCKQQIIRLRPQARALDKESKAMIKTDLAQYLRDRQQILAMTQTETVTAEYDELCQAVFSIPLTSSFVESLFSKMAYNQSKIRTRLADTTMSSILHLHDAALADPNFQLPDAMTLKAMIPRSLHDKLVMSKHIDERVCAFFDGVRFHGVVTKVVFHDVHAQYMYHVVYEDGDEEDYWRHELEMIRCTCDREENESDSNTD